MVRATVLSQVQAMIWRISGGCTAKAALDPRRIQQRSPRCFKFRWMLDADAESWSQSSSYKDLVSRS